MEMKLFIKNRKKQKIVLLVDVSPNQNGLAFVMHGLGGFKEQAHIKAFADVFKEEGFTVIRFDTTNTLGLGESEGKYEDATTTNYYEDLEDVIKLVKNKSWYQEPFWLAGHSLGGISIVLFAEKYPQKVKALAPISTVVSGKISFDSPKYRGNDILKKWKETGWRTEESKSQPGVIKKLKWSHMEDRLKYDVLPDAQKLKMPVSKYRRGLLAKYRTLVGSASKGAVTS
jgi:pimeloyl-ACP methyl ester carboxylesterase